MGLMDIIGFGIDAAGMDDGAVIDEASDEMYGMAGNEGQTAILDSGMDGFVNWAEEALSMEGASGDLLGYLNIDDEQLDATGEIWDAGAGIVGEAIDEMEEEDAELEAESEDAGGYGIWDAIMDFIF
jgi:hypothetical protein